MRLGLGLQEVCEGGKRGEAEEETYQGDEVGWTVALNGGRTESRITGDRARSRGSGGIGDGRGGRGDVAQ